MHALIGPTCRRPGRVEEAQSQRVEGVARTWRGWSLLAVAERERWVALETAADDLVSTCSERADDLVWPSEGADGLVQPSEGEHDFAMAESLGETEERNCMALYDEEVDAEGNSVLPLAAPVRVMK